MNCPKTNYTWSCRKKEISHIQGKYDSSLSLDKFYWYVTAHNRISLNYTKYFTWKLQISKRKGIVFKRVSYLHCQIHLHSPSPTSVLSVLSLSEGFSKGTLDQSWRQLEPVKRRVPKTNIYNNISTKQAAKYRLLWSERKKKKTTVLQSWNCRTKYSRYYLNTFSTAKLL